MKIIYLLWVNFLCCFALLHWQCDGENNSKSDLIASKTRDSVECINTWNNFHLLRDTLLQMKINDPVTLYSIDRKDKIQIIIVAISDFCSEESAKLTFGCDASIKLKIRINDKCEYLNDNFFGFPRYSEGLPLDIKSYDCNVGSSEKTPYYIVNGPFARYNLVFRLIKLSPFAKTDRELIDDLSMNKIKYQATVLILKRCY
jgi:hypothetical protein